MKVKGFLFIAILLSSYSSFSSLSLFINNANAQQLKPNAIVSPTCGDISGYGMT